MSSVLAWSYISKQGNDRQRAHTNIFSIVVVVFVVVVVVVVVVRKLAHKRGNTVSIKWVGKFSEFVFICYFFLFY